MERNKLYEMVSFVTLSDYRIQIMEALYATQRPQTPTELADETDIKRDYISRHLTKLKEKDLVELLNPDAHMNRYYELTEKGTELMEAMKEEGFIDSN